MYGECRENHIGGYVYEYHVVAWEIHGGSMASARGIYGGGLLVGKVQTGRSKIWLERWGGKK